MWCPTCQQDVPAVAAGPHSARVCCARCGEAVRTFASDSSEDDAPAQGFDFPRSASVPPASSLLDWKLDDELREAQRLVRLVKSQSDGGNRTAEQTDSDPSPKHSPAGARRSSGSGLFGWTLSGLGLSGLVCGCALLIWSLVTGRNELWTIGLPTALVSQVVLVCGVLLKRDDSEVADEQGRSQASTAVIQMQSSMGGMHPSGLSVHFSNASSGGETSLNSEQLRKEIEAVMRKSRAA